MFSTLSGQFRYRPNGVQIVWTERCLRALFPEKKILHKTLLFGSLEVLIASASTTLFQLTKYEVEMEAKFG